MDIEAKRALNNGFGDALQRSFEFVVTPTLMGLIGYFLDGRLGITPALTIALSLFTLGWMITKLWRGYESDMQAEEAAHPWARSKPTGTRG